MCAVVLTATAFIGGPPSGAAAPEVPELPETDNVFILPGASPDAWAPRLLGRIDPWSTDNPRVRSIDENQYDCESLCNLRVVRYPRTAGPVFGPNVPYADESIAIGVDLTTEEIHKAEGPMLVAGLSLGSITADAVQRAIDADPERPDPEKLTFIASGDPSRMTHVSTGIGAFLPEGFRIPLLGWTVTRPDDDSEYNTVVVVGEYDFTADFPDRPWNLLGRRLCVQPRSERADRSGRCAREHHRDDQREGRHHNHLSRATTDNAHPRTLQRRGSACGRGGQQCAQADRGLRLFAQRRRDRQPHAYLQPTDGLPRLVKGPRVTESFKATPNKTALPRLDRAITALGESRERMVTPLQRLRDLTRNWRPQREPDPVAAEEAS